MSKERELLEKIFTLYKGFSNCSKMTILLNEAKELLAQPKQEPVAWVTEWIQRYKYDNTPIISRAVSFIKGDVPAVQDPNYIPLYTAPSKLEPLSDEWIKNNIHFAHQDVSFTELVRSVEKAHGIGGGDE